MLFIRFHFVFIALTALISPIGNAQEVEHGPETDAVESESVSSDFREPLPVIIVEARQSVDERRRIEHETRFRAERDLAAQEGMNAATRRMATYSLAQTILVFVGTGALVYTLHLTRQANIGFQDATNKQLRPILIATGVDSTIQSDCDQGMLTIKNFGSSPAVTDFFTFKTVLGEVPNRQDAIRDLLNSSDESFDSRVFAPGYESKFGPVDANLSATLALRRGKRFYVFGVIKYRQALGAEIYVSEFGYEIRVDRETTSERDDDGVTVHMSASEIPGFCTVEQDCVAWERNEKSSKYD